MKIINIIRRALKMESALYYDIEKNNHYEKDSIIIAFITIVLSSVGFKGLNIFDLITTVIYMALGLVLWGGTAFIISLKFLSSRIHPKAFMRCLAVGFSPMIFNILYLLPHVGFYASIIIFLWTVASIAIVLKVLLEQETALCIVLSALGSVCYFIIRIAMIG